MKMQLFKKLSLGLVLGLISVVSFVSNANAQSGRVLKFEVSFNFQVGNEKYTAGKYNLQPLGKGQFVLKNEENKGSVFYANTLIGEDSADTPARLVFNRYGDDYFLNQVFSESNKKGVELFVSKAEKKARKNMKENEQDLSKNLKPEQISVILVK